MGRLARKSKKANCMLTKLRTVPLPACETRRPRAKPLDLSKIQTASRPATSCTESISDYLMTSSFNVAIFPSMNMVPHQAFHGSVTGRVQQYVMAKATEAGIARRKRGESLRNLVIQRAPGTGEDDLVAGKKWETAITDYIKCNSLKTRERCMQNILSSTSHAAQVAKRKTAISTHMREFVCDLVTKKAAVFYFMEPFLFENESAGTLVTPQCKRHALITTFAEIDGTPMSLDKITELELKTHQMLHDPQYAPKPSQWHAFPPDLPPLCFVQSLSVGGHRVTQKTTDEIVKHLLFVTKHKVRNEKLMEKNTAFKYKVHHGGVTKYKKIRKSIESIIVPGMRYCSHCERMLPIARFPKSVTLSTCMKCWGASTRASKTRRYKERLYEFDAEFLRKLAYQECQKTFKLAKTPLTVQDCRLLCYKHKLNVWVFSLLPRDPRQPLTVNNMIIVETKTWTNARRFLNPVQRPQEYTQTMSELEQRDCYWDTGRARFTSKRAARIIAVRSIYVKHKPTLVFSVTNPLSPLLPHLAGNGRRIQEYDGVHVPQHIEKSGPPATTLDRWAKPRVPDA
jgi:hypothetical protein